MTGGAAFAVAVSDPEIASGILFEHESEVLRSHGWEHGLHVLRTETRGEGCRNDFGWT
jgi:hypothetical protein